MHPDQLEVPVHVVRALVDEQFPQWRDRPITPVPPGTVNAIFRLGDDLAARFPLRPGDGATILDGLRREAEAARELLGRTAFRTPAPVAIGEPGAGYPLPWAVQTWVPGTAASARDAACLPFARDLASLVVAVRAIDVRGRRFGSGGVRRRGGDLRAHDDWMEQCCRRSEGLVDVARVRGLWRQLRDLPRIGPDVMSHGDLIPGNVLTNDGRLAGVIDVGGFGPADPALDLVAGWHLLDAVRRREFRRLLGCGDLEWARGAGWALEQAMGVVWYYRDSNPGMARMGDVTLARILGDGIDGIDDGLDSGTGA